MARIHARGGQAFTIHRTSQLWGGPVSNIDINLTTTCNMTCSFCGSWGFEKEGAHVPLEVVERALDAAAELGYTIATMTGGEPTLHPKFNDIIRMAHDRGFMTLVTTNGLRVRPEMIETFRHCGTVIRVSLHTLNPERHRELTGAPTHHRVIANMEKLRDGGIPFGVGCTVEEANIHEGPGIAQLAWRLSASYMRFSPVVAIRGAEGSALNEDFYRRLLRTVFGLCVANKQLLQYRRPQMPSQLKNQTTHMLTRTCAAGSPLHIIHDCNGRLQPCSFLPEDTRLYSAPGLAPDEGIHSCWDAMNTLQASLKGNLEGKCGTCEFADVCLGGCLAPKIDHQLPWNAEQPLCMKDLVDETLEYFTDAEQKFLMGYWDTLYARKIDQRNMGKNCVRHLPVWELNFKPAWDRNPEAFSTVEVPECAFS